MLSVCWVVVNDSINFADASRFMLTSDRIDHSYKIQNPKITKDRKVPDPSNDSSCEAFFLENRKTVIS